ncbi:MAG: hypothetical protein FWF76_05445 [Oscillospiraceae bacterium]|nr:hypothetical protein [Oscillospiraceae bacterium]
MFCENCGSSFEVGSQVCGKCKNQRFETTVPEVGAMPEVGVAPIQHQPVQPEMQVQQQFQQPVQPTQPMQVQSGEFPVPDASQPQSDVGFSGININTAAPTEMTVLTSAPKSRTKKLIFACVGGVAAIAIIAVVCVQLFFGNDLQVQRAMNNFEGEVAQRLESSPFGAFLMLMESLENDMMFEMEARDLTGIMGDVNGSIRTYLVPNRQESAFIVDVRAMGMRVDASVYSNRDGMVFGSSLLGRDYFGFKYDTFENGMNSFGDALGLDLDVIDMIVDMMNYVQESINNPVDIEAWIEPYDRLIEKHILKANNSSQNGVEVGNISTRRIAYTFNNAAVLALFEDLLEMLENDEVLNNSMSWASDFDFVDMWDEMMRHLVEDALADFDLVPDFNIELAFYIGRGNRLVQISAEVESEDEFDVYSIVANFGASADDSWTVRAYTNDEIEGYIEWRVNLDRGRHELIVDGRTYFEVNWNSSNGNFTIAFDAGGFVGRQELSGNYLPSDDGFELSFDIEGMVEINLVLETSNVTVPTPSSSDFIDIVDWADVDFESILSGGILGDLIQSAIGLGGMTGISPVAPPWDGWCECADRAARGLPLPCDWCL